jgi:hypothetical protein
VTASTACECACGWVRVEFNRAGAVKTSSAQLIHESSAFAEHVSHRRVHLLSLLYSWRVSTKTRGCLADAFCSGRGALVGTACDASKSCRARSSSSDYFGRSIHSCKSAASQHIKAHQHSMSSCHPASTPWISITWVRIKAQRGQHWGLGRRMAIHASAAQGRHARSHDIVAHINNSLIDVHLCQPLTDYMRCAV